MMHHRVAALAAVALWACSSDESMRSDPRKVEPPSPITPPTAFFTPQDPAFTTQEGWSEDVKRAVFDDAYSTNVARVATDPEHQIVWVLLRRQASPFGRSLFELRAYDQRGAVAWSSNDDPALSVRAMRGASIADIAVHSDATLSVLELRPLEGRVDSARDVESTLHFLRLDARGVILADVPFLPRDDPKEQLVCGYELARGAYTCMPKKGASEGPAHGWYSVSIGGDTAYPKKLAHRMLADGDGLIFLRTGGVPTTLYRLNSGYEPERSVMVLPESGGDSWYSPRLARDTSGRIVVLTGAGQDMLDALAAAGGPRLTMPQMDPPLPRSSASSMLHYFDGATLERIATQVIAVQGELYPAALVTDGDEVIGIMTGRFRRSTVRNKTMEQDAVLVRASPNAAPKTYHLLDIARDEAVADAVMGSDGTLWIAGKTNYLRADTSSQMEDAEGFVVGLDREFRVGPTLRLRGPRNVEVHSIALGGTPLVLGGALNGPITHTCDADPTKKDCYQSSFFGSWQTTNAQRTANWNPTAVHSLPQP